MKNTIKVILALLTVALMASTSAFADTDRLGSAKAATFNATAIVTKTAAYTATTSDSFIKVDATSSAITITLPQTTTLSGVTQAYKILKTDSSTNMVTVSAGTGDTIGGEASRKVINQNDYMIVRSGPGKYWTVSYESSYLAENHLNGTVALVGGATSYNLFTTISTNTALTSANCGQTIKTITDALSATLPTSVANCKITFVNASSAGLVGITVAGYGATEVIYGTVASPSITTFSSTKAIHTKTTAKKGDYLSIIGDGTGWWIVGGIGIWANN